MSRPAPRFWWRQEPGLAALALAPLGAVYGAVAARRMARSGPRIAIPVLCIGNFVVGGAGKTPTALAVAQRLLARGEKPVFVSRGYGRRRSTAKRGAKTAALAVSIERDTPETVGDEPLLLARVAPCFVADDRVSAARAAMAAGASVVLMDDGFQSAGLARDANLVVVDCGAGVGNGFCLPAGPLRAPLEHQWADVQLMVAIGAGHPGDRLVADAGRRGIAVVRGRLEPDPAVVAALANRRLLAFSGIGRPGKFFTSLTDCGLDVVDRIGFPDHHVFTAKERDALVADARAADATLVTTEKDRVRLPQDFPVATFPVDLRFEDERPLDRLLDAVLSSRA